MVSLLVSVLSAKAQTADVMFVNMPDSIFPYLTKDQRQELVSLRNVDASTPAVLRSALNCSVSMTYLDAERLTVEVDSTVVMEIARQPVSGADSVFCMLTTVATPERDTQADIYDKDWNRAGEVPLADISLVQRPDTMGENAFSELTKLIEIKIVEAHFVDASTIAVKQNVPLVSRDERKRLDAILVERKLKWDGKSFQTLF